MFPATGWQQFEVVDAGGGNKLERWGDVYVLRPDPQAIWKANLSLPEYQRVYAVYTRNSRGGGTWTFKRTTPDDWVIAYDTLRFRVKPMGFKHMGLFPEQAANWVWLRDILTGRHVAATGTGRTINILNLFAYTGGATVACAASNPHVSITHVDAARGMVRRAQDNAVLSGVGKVPVRYIVDDCMKFIQREKRRGVRYDGVIMDPPAYGRGTGGELWKLEDEIYDLVVQAAALLSECALFFLLNSYTTGLGAQTMENMLKLALSKHGGTFESGELCLPITHRGLYLPCGNTVRWRQ